MEGSTGERREEGRENGGERGGRRERARGGREKE